MESLSVISLVRKKTHKTQWHSHAEGQIFFINKGLLVIKTKKAQWIMPADQIAWVPPNLYHSAESFGPIEGSILYLHLPFSKRLSENPLAFASNSFLKDIMLRILTCKKHKADELKKQALVQVMLDELDGLTPEFLYINMPTDKTLQKAAQVFMTNPSVEKTLVEWAEMVNMTTRTFTRHFRHQTGMSFTKWCQVVRIQHALKHLAKGKSITWIALTLGYNSVSAFIKVFRQYLGKTPAKFLLKDKL